MALKYRCKECSKYVVPRRIKGHYIGDNEVIKIWECPACLALWR